MNLTKGLVAICGTAIIISAMVMGYKDALMFIPLIFVAVMFVDD